MWECLADKWGRRCMKVSTNTALLESYFGAMLRDSLGCDVGHRRDNGKENLVFYFRDCSILQVTLDQDGLCEEAKTARRPS